MSDGFPTQEEATITIPREEYERLRDAGTKLAEKILSDLIRADDQLMADSKQLMDDDCRDESRELADEAIGVGKAIAITRAIIDAAKGKQMSNHRHEVKAPGFSGSYPTARLAADAAKERDLAIVTCDGYLTAAVYRGKIITPIGQNKTAANFVPVKPGGVLSTEQELIAHRLRNGWGDGKLVRVDSLEPGERFEDITGRRYMMRGVIDGDVEAWADADYLEIFDPGLLVLREE